MDRKKFSEIIEIGSKEYENEEELKGFRDSLDGELSEEFLECCMSLFEARMRRLSLTKEGEAVIPEGARLPQSLRHIIADLWSREQAYEELLFCHVAQKTPVPDFYI